MFVHYAKVCASICLCRSHFIFVKSNMDKHTGCEKNYILKVGGQNQIPLQHRENQHRDVSLL